MDEGGEVLTWISIMLEGRKATYFIVTLTASGDMGVEMSLLHTKEGVPVTAWLPEVSLFSCRHTQEIWVQLAPGNH